MSPDAAKSTFSTNHVQTLEAVVNAALKEFDKYKDTDPARKAHERGGELLKELGALKQSAGKLQLDGPEFSKAKTDVTHFQSDAKSALIDLAHALTEADCSVLEAMVKQVTEAVAKAKAGSSDEGKKCLSEADVLTRRVNNLKLQIGKIPTTDKAYLDLKSEAGKLINATKVALAELAKAPKLVLKFGGSPVAEEADMIAKIKSHLPQSGHTNINQAWSDAVLGRGKSTGSLGCLHASAGKIGKNSGGCTIFFKRSGNEIDVIGVGQHQDAGKNQTTYTIHYGLGKKSVTL